MEIDQSSLMPEITTILKGSGNPVHFAWHATIHVNQRNLDFPVMKVIEVDMVSDYELNYTDEIQIAVAIPGGQYANQIYPFRDDLDVTITKTPLAESGDTPNMAQQVQVTRYQATILDRGDPMIQGGMNTPSQEALDLTSMLTIRFQLIDKALEQLRMCSTGMIFKQATVGDALKGILTQLSQNAQLDQSLAVLGVQMVAPSNQNVRDHIVIPHGTELIDIPEWIQAKQGGIYSAGLGAYLRNRYWFIYPRYDTTRLATAEHTATIILVPENRMPNVERTYRKNGDSLVIIATGSIQFRGDSTPAQLNAGNGVRFMDASKVMGQYAVTQKNIAVAARGNINNEFVATQRPNGLNVVKLAPNAITENPFAVTSDLARRNGSVVSFIWENSNDALLTPDTMVNVLYLDNDTVQSLSGVLLKTHSYTAMSGPGMTNGRHITRTVMSCFVQNPTS